MADEDEFGAFFGGSIAVLQPTLLPLPSGELKQICETRMIAQRLSLAIKPTGMLSLHPGSSRPPLALQPLRRRLAAKTRTRRAAKRRKMTTWCYSHRWGPWAPRCWARGPVGEGTGRATPYVAHVTRVRGVVAGEVPIESSCAPALVEVLPYTYSLRSCACKGRVPLPWLPFFPSKAARPWFATVP